MAVKYHKDAFPPDKLDWKELAEPLSNASDAIGRYDSFLSIIPNPRLLVSPLIVNEAVTSSRIEGTRTTVHEVLAFEAGNTNISQSQKDDIQEVSNYRSALQHAIKMLKDFPITGRVLKTAHAELLKGVRGQYKSPGLYRTEQNWIGLTNNIEEARYIPISPNELEDAMAKWERYVNSSNDPSLVKIAIAHAEFESIHPFLDGNGRIGRIMIPLMLCTENKMSSPCFYMSEFFEHRNNEYQNRLLAVSADNDWTEWCEFFLGAIETQAKENLSKAQAIHDLYNKTRTVLLEISKSSYAEKIIDKLFEAPIFSAKDLTQMPSINDKTARRLMNMLKDAGIIKEFIPHSGQRAAIMVFPKLLEITENISIK